MSIFHRITVAGMTVLTTIGFGSSALADTNPYLDAVKKFADTVLEHGRDKYGDKQTPLFVDGLHSETMEPAIWRWRNNETWVTSNFATQQPLMQMLDALTTLTDEAKYREAAEGAAAYMLENAAPSGLLAWGDHIAWDLQQDIPVGTTSGNNPPEEFRFIHDLKTHPYYELMWRVNPEAARRAMHGFWNGHITSWETLDFNRHARAQRRMGSINWDRPFDADREVPHQAEGGHLSFAGIISVFLQASVDLALLDDDEQAFIWSDRMITQWHRNRNPETGLSGGQISWRGGDGDRSRSALSHIYPQINEAVFLATYHHARYYSLALAQLEHANRLQKAGKYSEAAQRWIQWASDDLKAYATHVYDRENQRFRTMLTDGTVVTAEAIEQMKPGYYTPDDILPMAPTTGHFSAYAKAYVLTRDVEHWQTLRDIAKYFDLGDLGEPDGTGRAVNLQTEALDWRLMYPLLDLHEATGNDDFLKLASRLGDNLLGMQHASGLFPRPAPKPRPEGTAVAHEKIPGTVQPARQYARTGDEIPLALLHLAAKLEGKYDAVPQPPAPTQRFQIRYWGPLEPHQQKRDDNRTFDYLVFYGPDLYW
jgi:pectate lyase